MCNSMPNLFGNLPTKKLPSPDGTFPSVRNRVLGTLHLYRICIRCYTLYIYTGTRGHLRITYPLSKINGVRRGKPHSCLPHVEKNSRPGRTWRPCDRKIYYQLAFFTPGIKPFDAISRN